MAGKELGGSAEVLVTSSQGDWGLQTGLDQRSSDEAGRADGAGRGTEDGERRHVGVFELTGVN